jgi:hypothetical protein
MRKARSKFFKLLIISSLLVVMCLVLLLSGISPLVVFISVSVLGLLLWLFTRSTPPEGEMPCASVSCCHYLQDKEEEIPQ